jgi:hypothetical protein
MALTFKDYQQMKISSLLFIMLGFFSANLYAEGFSEKGIKQGMSMDEVMEYVNSKSYTISQFGGDDGYIIKEQDNKHVAVISMCNNSVDRLVLTLSDNSSFVGYVKYINHLIKNGGYKIISTEVMSAHNGELEMNEMSMVLSRDNDSYWMDVSLNHFSDGDYMRLSKRYISECNRSMSK